MNVRDAIRKAASKRILYLPHALTRMNLPEQMITAEEVREVVFNGEIIEDYPDDPRGHSCLMCRWTTKNRPIHVVCSPKDEYLAVITVYVPSPKEWEADFKTRKK